METSRKMPGRGVKSAHPLPDPPAELPHDMRPIWCADPEFIRLLPLAPPDKIHRIKYYYRVGLLTRSRDDKVKLKVLKTGRAYYTTLRWWIDFWSTVNEISPQKLCDDLGVKIDFAALAEEKMRDFNAIPPTYGDR